MSQVENRKVSLVDDEIKVFAYLEILWRYRYIIMGFLIAAVLATAVVNRWIIPARYEAISLIQVGETYSLQTEQVYPLQVRHDKLSLGSVDAYKAVLLSSKVLKQVADAARNQKIPPETRVEIAPGSSLIKLVIQGESPVSAEKLGNVWYNTFINEMQKMWVERLEKQLDLQRAIVESMKEEFPPAYLVETSNKNGGIDKRIVIQENGNAIIQAVGELKQNEIMLKRVRQNQIDDILIISPFKASEKPVTPRKTLNFVLASFLALTGGVFSAFSIDGWRNYKHSIN